MESNRRLEEEQKNICKRYGAEWSPVAGHQKVGISLNVKNKVQPINGLRYPIDGDVSGWYIWAGGEIPDDPNFFLPLHAEHIKDWCPSVQKYLGLPPGFRFSIADDYEDVWEDASLLSV
ncbi:hypothetical protein [Nitratireductor sp. ZSWI3]|uniref:immunity protein Imm33 domain-containing protein n=1 Tax=Nitratireductor sp. ZSWI3 TaxID=2966359 RepID=UPI0021505603|nr:hypothetical protein [Nitratireductor sp. ZSWI3]MCR4269482.1 hypothetical protein [Nitratireductor sp. ZSWI3]